ncbi:MAG: hypothetical protein HY221_00780, partial [Candidatus Sungbacteria bacterium]|nr:hypothetical protein [Candidatus Sungbacteria bacterium]
IPIAVIRDQLEIRSAASLADYSFILKQYRRDLSIADIYIPRDQYDKKKVAILTIIKKYHTSAPAELILDP